MTQHTPGPWTVEGYDALEGGFEIWSNEPEYLGQLAIAYHNEDGEDKDIAEANARLIAAAPDLLSVLQKWTDVVQGGDELDRLEPWAREMVTEVRAIIAKATGK